MVVYPHSVAFPLAFLPRPPATWCLTDFFGNIPLSFKVICQIRFIHPCNVGSSLPKSIKRSTPKLVHVAKLNSHFSVEFKKFSSMWFELGKVQLPKHRRGVCCQPFIPTPPNPTKWLSCSSLLCTMYIDNTMK